MRKQSTPLISALTLCLLISIAQTAIYSLELPWTINYGQNIQSANSVPGLFQYTYSTDRIFYENLPTSLYIDATNSYLEQPMVYFVNEYPYLTADNRIFIVTQYSIEKVELSNGQFKVLQTFKTPLTFANIKSLYSNGYILLIGQSSAGLSQKIIVFSTESLEFISDSIFLIEHFRQNTEKIDEVSFLNNTIYITTQDSKTKNCNVYKASQSSLNNNLTFLFEDQNCKFYDLSQNIELPPLLVNFDGSNYTTIFRDPQNPQWILEKQEWAFIDNVNQTHFYTFQVSNSSILLCELTSNPDYQVTILSSIDVSLLGALATFKYTQYLYERHKNQMIATIPTFHKSTTGTTLIIDLATGIVDSASPSTESFKLDNGTMVSFVQNGYIFIDSEGKFQFYAELDSERPKYVWTVDQYQGVAYLVLCTGQYEIFVHKGSEHYSGRIQNDQHLNCNDSLLMWAGSNATQNVQNISMFYFNLENIDQTWIYQDGQTRGLRPNQSSWNYLNYFYNSDGIFTALNRYYEAEEYNIVTGESGIAGNFPDWFYNKQIGLNLQIFWKWQPEEEDNYIVSLYSVHPAEQWLEFTVNVEEYINEDYIFLLNLDAENRELKTIVYQDCNGVNYCEFSNQKVGDCKSVWSGGLLDLDQIQMIAHTNQEFQVSYYSQNAGFVKVTFYELTADEDEENNRLFLEVI